MRLVGVSAACVLLLAAIVAYPVLTGDSFVTDLATDMALWATLAIGLNAVLGWAGLLDLGYIAFFAIGGYVYAILSEKDILQFWPGLIAAVLISAVAAVIIGVPSLRLRSDYLAIMTLGFGEIVYIAAKNLTGLTGGNNGLYQFNPPSIGGFVFSSAASFYGMAVVLLALAAGVSLLVRRSRLGRSWMTLRDDELVASSFGVAVRRAKLLAYVYGSVWGALAGAVFAAKQTIVSPTSFSFDQSFYVLAAVVIGGMGGVWGVAIGGIVYIFISEGLQGVSPGLSGVIFGGAMLLAILVRPQGLVPVGSVARVFDRLAGREPAGLPQRQAPVDRLVADTQEQGAHSPQHQPVPHGQSNSNRTEGDARASLSATGVQVRFGGVRAVQDVDLSCDGGTILALIGSNGAGKTTLINALTGLVAIHDGTITLRRDGLESDLTHLPAAGRAHSGLARAFQTPRLSRTETVAENVRRGTLATRRARRGGAARVQEALEIVGLADVARAQAGDLSYGDQRRCEIARTLAGDPYFLLLDEPSSGMNDVETRALGGLLRDIAAHGPGIILVEHDMSLVREDADRVIAMDIGEIIAEGSPSQVLADDTVRARYLGEA